MKDTALKPGLTAATDKKNNNNQSFRLGNMCVEVKGERKTKKQILKTSF